MADKFLVVRWLLQHTGVLKDIAAIVAGWTDGLSLAGKLEIVYKIALALVPVIETFPVFKAQAVEITEAEAEEDLVKVQAIGIPLPIILTIIGPIVSTLINIIIQRRND